LRNFCKDFDSLKIRQRNFQITQSNFRIPQRNFEISLFYNDVFKAKIVGKCLEFSKNGEKFSLIFYIPLKLNSFRKLRKTGIFRNFFRKDDFARLPKALKTGGCG